MLAKPQSAGEICSRKAAKWAAVSFAYSFKETEWEQRDGEGSSGGKSLVGRIGNEKAIQVVIFARATYFGHAHFKRIQERL